MISRHRYGKIADFNCLFSKFVSPNKIQLNMLHEWVDPITFDGKGAFPFRTGISSIRLAVSSIGLYAQKRNRVAYKQTN